MKITVNLDDNLYTKLVKETVEKYGNTKSLSRLINEKLGRAEEIATRTDSDKIKRRLKILRESTGSWKIKTNGKEYAKKTRRGWNKRLKPAVCNIEDNF